ncbi:MAG: transposase [Candidatus Electronema sp. V4]|uniref:transposase n=1 Tax=Candidatus Electronema sp. V4 TaxID=3454756 RepID=UPI0040555F73
MGIKELQAAGGSSHHHDGTLNEIKARLLGLAQNEGLICWSSGAVDGSFSPGKGGGAEVSYGYKGKGVLIHLLADADGMPLSACSAPANKDERKQVGPLLDMIAVKTGKLGRPPQKPQIIAADKGYDSDQLRDFLKRKGIRPQIPRKKNASKRQGRPIGIKAPRF